MGAAHCRRADAPGDTPAAAFTTSVYGGTPDQARYSSLRQITRANVSGSR